jgi:hypothetical protein
LDIYNSSPALAGFLKRHTMDCIGTLSLNRNKKNPRKDMQYISILDLLQLRNGVVRKMLSIFSLYHTDERKAVAVGRKHRNQSA